MTYFHSLQVARAAGMPSTSVLYNVINRNRLRLESKSLGRRCNRPWSRGDIDHLALGHSLTTLTGHSAWSSAAVDAIPDDEELWSARYTHKVSETWMVFADLADIENGRPHLMIWNAGERPANLMWAEAGYTLNVTRVLAAVDRRLLELENVNTVTA